MSASLLTFATVWSAVLSGQVPTPPQAPPTSDPATRSVDAIFADQMIRAMLPRMAEEIIGELTSSYDLSDEQGAAMQAILVKRAVKFFEENRAGLYAAIGGMVQMQMGMEAPKPEEVAEWTDKAQPILKKIREEVPSWLEETRSVLNPLQNAQFERTVLEVNAGLQFMENRLEGWRKGDYSERDFWDPPRSVRRQREAERRAQREAQRAQEPEDQVGIELKRWEAYVADFIKHYQLDEAQRTTARSLLKEHTDRATVHATSRRAEIDRLERRISTHSGDEIELAGIKEELQALYGPIDEMFTDLKARLDGILTTQQRTIGPMPVKKDSEKDKVNPSPVG